MNSAGGSKAQMAHDTFAQVAKKSIGAENLSDEVILKPGTSDSPQNTSHPSGEGIDEDQFCHSVHWQASEELSSFLATLHKRISAFWRKAITRKYPHPYVSLVYTPALDNYITNLVPCIKTVNKDLQFWQDRVLLLSDMNR